MYQHSLSMHKPNTLSLTQWLEREILSHWELWFEEEHRPRQLRVLKMPARNSRIMLLYYAGSETTPIVVAKLSPGGSDEYLRQELHVLKILHEQLSVEFGSTIPKPLLHATYQANTIYLQSGLSGQAMMRSMTLRFPGPWRKSLLNRRLDRTVDWLTQFHSATRTGSTTVKDVLDNSLRPNIEHYLGTGATSPDVRSCLSKMMDLATTHSHLQLPTTAQHGDFTPGNILFSGDDVGVLDWEHSSFHQFPYLDIYLLPLALIVMYTVKRTVTSRLSFAKPTDFQEQASKRFVERYFELMQLPPSLTSVFLFGALVTVINRLNTSGDSSGLAQANHYQHLLSSYANDWAK